MKELSVKNRKCSSVRQLVSFICILSGMIISCSASSTTEDTLSSSTTTLLESEDLYCSQESCQELRERVESLEEAFRAFVSALSNDETNRHFATVSRKMSKNRAVQSLLSASASTNIFQEEESVSTETPSQSKPRQHNETASSVSSSVHHLKHAVKCSLAYVLDIHVSESHRRNESGGILNATLHRHQQREENKSIEIEWSPPLASCIESVTGLWVRVYESGTDPAFEPYLSIPRKCLTSKYHPSGREALSIFLPSSNSSLEDSTNNDECSFSIDSPIDCRSYQVEVVPDYHSLRGKSIQAEVIIPPTMDTMTRLKSSMTVSVQFDSLELGWEDNSGCAPRLTSVNLKLWPDGIVHKEGDDITLLKTAIKPIIYTIPKSCLEKVPRDGNIFSVTLSSNHSSCSQVQWKSLDKCRKYVLEMESQYSSAWTGPSSSKTIFTSIKQDLSRYPINPYFDSANQVHWSQCKAGDILCYQPPSNPYNHGYGTQYRTSESYFCRSHDYVCNGGYECRDPVSKNTNIYIDEKYCEDRHTCLSGFKCGRQCIPRDLLCDGKYDCLNGEDESFAQCDYMNSCQHISSSTNGTFPSKEPFEFKPKDSNVFIKAQNLAKKYTLLISVKPDQVIWVDFVKLDNSNKRTKVKLYDGPYSNSPVLLSHDDIKKPLSVRSSGPNLYIEYYSYQNETVGVKAFYTTMEKTEQPFIKGCGGYVNVLKGDSFVSSPNWKNIESEAITTYPNHCFWFIEARNEGETILLRRDTTTPQSKLEFLLSQISSPITVYDSWNTSGVVLYNNTMESKDTIFSSSSKMLVRYSRPIINGDNTIENISWNVLTIFSPQCKQSLTASTGIVTSPNYPLPYLKSSDCHWNIAVETGSTIRLLFAVFQTQEKKDFVYVHDGPTVYHPILMEKSGNVSTPFVINSSSNQVLVRFTSDIGFPFNGFLAVYSTV